MADLDPVQLGFTFAKELATQLITLSTGILALSVTYHKEILKGITGGAERLLRIAWCVQLVSIVGGIWSLMALTGTLMPLDPKTRVLQFGGNVRLPAMVQVGAFLLGTALLMIVYGRRVKPAGQDQYQLAVLAVDAMGAQLAALKADRWEVVCTTVRESDQVAVLLKRPVG